MKKLVLALVCFVGVAFFASCDPDVVLNPEPSIAILAEEGYLADGDVIDMEVEYPYGFRVASNAETQVELSNLTIVCNGSTLCDTTISGTEFVYRGTIYFTNADDSRDVFDAEIIATVTDANGKTNKASIKLGVNEAVLLTVTDFTWNRHGGQAATGGLEELGLEWKLNALKEIYAVITPMEGATMYRFDEGVRDVWNNTVTVADKATLFGDETLTPITELKEVSCTAPEKEYDIVIGTVYNGETHLIHITKSTVFTFKGTDVTITGQVK